MHPRDDENRSPAHHAVDPVCGMAVDPKRCVHRLERNGTTFFFCSASCRERFAAGEKASPSCCGHGGRTAPSAAPAVPAKPGATYTCPMHPEVRQEGPGACPICGMALEPELLSKEESPDPELEDMFRRFKGSLFLTLPLFVLSKLFRRRARSSR